VDEIEVDPYTLEEVERILVTALKRRNGFRWMLALIFGFRQGEALGFQWSDYRIDGEDAGNETIYVRRSRLRPKYSHGCPDPCGKKYGGHCPQRVEPLEEASESSGRSRRAAARHTTATLALLAGVLDRTAQVLFGWATAKNGDRYRHVTRAVQRDAADRLEALVWSPRLALESGAETRNATLDDDA